MKVKISNKCSFAYHAITAFFLILYAGAQLSCGPKKSTLPKELSDFKVEDTASIDKIFLADKGDNQVLLTREHNHWMVNGEFRARPDMIQNLLHTIRRLEVKQFVPKPAVENVIKNLAVAATKVEIYQNGKLKKTFYVGGPTQDHLGTYMLMQGSDVPFVCYVPGFRGYLTNHFHPMEVEWKDRKIFAYELNEIASVKVEFVRNPDQSWEIYNVDNAKLKLKSLQANRFVEDFDTLLAKDILRNFKVMGFEGFVQVNPVRMDSVKSKYGLYRVTVNERSGGRKFVDLYEIPLQPGTLDMLGRPVAVDVDRMYGLVDGQINTICQYYTFDPVTIPLEAFLPEKPPK